MADKPKEDGFNPFNLAIEVLVIFFVAFFIFQSIGNFLGSDKGSLGAELRSFFFGAKNTIIDDSGEVSIKGIGEEITQLRPTILYDVPGGEAIKGIAAGIRGSIVDGPLDFDSITWWKILYADDSLGWVPQTSFLAESAETLSDLAENPEGPVSEFYRSFVMVSTTISFLLLIGIAYSSIRLFQIRKAEHEKLYGHIQKEVMAAEAPEEQSSLKAENKTRWEVIQKHAESPSESDRRLAVLEADIFLDDILKARGYVGEGLGERLKSVDKSDFRTLEQAWEAHKIRNAIAHEGVHFPLSERESRRIIGLYGEVFREFGYI